MGTLSPLLHVVVLNFQRPLGEGDVGASVPHSLQRHLRTASALLGGAAEMAMRLASARKRSGTTHVFLTAVLGALGQLGRTADL